MYAYTQSEYIITMTELNIIVNSIVISKNTLFLLAYFGI
ncbi:hypothetical protein J2T56_001185 [Natronobacillus azotifigens]